jgi:tRNA(fMet)-specific endonuclease VapC
MKFLLDSNSIISMLNEPTGPVATAARQHQPADMGLSSIVLHELYYGAYKSQRQDRNLALVDALPFEVLALDHEDARHAGEVRATLAKEGKPIGPYDALIAGQAISRNLILVTDNVGEFQRVADLKMVNWLRA